MNSLKSLKNKEEYTGTAETGSCQTQEKVSAFDLKYTLFLYCVCKGITLGTCFMYLHSNSALSDAKQRTSYTRHSFRLPGTEYFIKGKSEYNDDLDQIYQIATGELGMVYADESQIIYYNSSNDDYVQQYESIPDKQ